MGSVVHEEELDILDVADKEGTVAGGDHESGLLVGAVADLQKKRNISIPPQNSQSLQGENVPRAWQGCP